MSDAPSHDERKSTVSASSSWAGWMLTILAVPVLYVLTFPPIVILSYKLGASWMAVYCVPYAWVADHTPLHAPLQWYVEWWVSITGFWAP